MIEAAVKALNQMASRPFRTVLWKSIGLAVVFLVLVGIGLQRLLAALLHSATVWAEATIGTGSHAALDLVQLGLAIVASLGVIAGMVFLMPAVAALVASFFADEIAEHVERRYYPADLPGRPLPLPRALMEGLKTALLSILIYLCAVPFLLFAGLGIVIFFVASAFLLSREYFELAAMRFHPPAEARALRKRHQGTVFLAGILIAAFVSIPIVNLATPLFATALMVHIHKRLTESRRELIEPVR
ncbi:MAG: sulfate transporter family protein [Variibacter sp.]